MLTASVYHVVWHPLFRAYVWGPQSIPHPCNTYPDETAQPFQVQAAHSGSSSEITENHVGTLPPQPTTPLHQSEAPISQPPTVDFPARAVSAPKAQSRPQIFPETASNTLTTALCTNTPHPCLVHWDHGLSHLFFILSVPVFFFSLFSSLDQKP